METILFLAHTEADGTLAKSAFEAIGAAKSLTDSLAGSAFVAGVVGQSVQAAADRIGTCGATRLFGAAGPAYAQSRYSTDAAAAEALAKAAQASIIIAPATSRWLRALPGVAQRLGGKVDTHVVGISVAGDKVSVNRWYYRQRMEANQYRSQRPWIILLDPGSLPAWSGEPCTVSVNEVEVPLDSAAVRTHVVGYRELAGEAQTIRPDAELLFVAGAGWTKKQADGQAHPKEAEQLILDCLRNSRASLGSTKSLVDLGTEGHTVLSFLTHLNQVGQTGSTPRHPKGLATCCHGEEPHTVGWRFINERRAVNTDPNCGWARGKADVLYVADAFAVMKKLNALLQK